MKNRRIRRMCIIALCVVLFVYLSIFINSLMNKNKIGIFAWRFYIMSSDSKEADIATGDLVVAKSIKTEKIKENDDIIYMANDEMIVKRIQTVDNSNGNANFYIQADNGTNSVSGQRNDNVQIIGKVLFKIKGLGNVALFIQSPLGTLNVLIIAICLMIIIKKVSKSIQGEESDGKC